ncbi:MAG TPA: SGNH/GDSL hydrolase family protein, partial [bacterium]|nr:SGNH/GDSL hydrolase family protein [bacterium]
VTFGIVLSVVTLELLVRLAGAKPQTYLRKFSRYHTILGWEKTPLTEGKFRKGDVIIHEKINSRGLRDSEYTYEKPSNTFRILVLGDSFTEGYDVEINDLFTEILESKLNTSSFDSSSIRYEVINAGTGGYSTDQEFLYFEIEGIKYKPDMVLLMVYPANDIFYNHKSKYGNYNKPFFQIRNDSLILTNTPLQEPYRQESIKNLFREMALYPIVTQIILTKYPRISQTLSHFGFISESTLAATAANLNSISDSSASSFSVYKKYNNFFMNTAWQKTSRIIYELNKKSKEIGTRLVMFYIPDRIEVYDSDWKKTKEKFSLEDHEWSPDVPSTMLKKISDTSNIPLLDFRQYISKKELGDSVLYNGIHWNVSGNRFAAEFIYEALFHEKATVKQ